MQIVCVVDTIPREHFIFAPSYHELEGKQIIENRRAIYNYNAFLKHYKAIL